MTQAHHARPPPRANDMKTCSKCKQEKPLDQFHRHRKEKDGRRSQCKVCRKARHATPEYKAYQKAYQAIYRASDNGKAAQDRYRSRNPEKRKAKDVITNAVRDGKLAPVGAQACATCGEPAAHYHHEAYERPLDVIPLCRTCHVTRHREAKHV